MTKHDWLRAVMRARLPAGAAKVAWCLADLATANAVAWPLVATIAAAVQLDEKNVRAHLHALRDAGWIVIEDRRHLRRESWYWLTEPTGGEPRPLGDFDAPPKDETRGVVRATSSGQERPVEESDPTPDGTTSRRGSRPDAGARSNAGLDRAAAPARRPDASARSECSSTGRNRSVRPGEIAPFDRAASPARPPSHLSLDRSEIDQGPVVSAGARAPAGGRAGALAREPTTTVDSIPLESLHAKRGAWLWAEWSRRFVETRGQLPADISGGAKAELVTLVSHQAVADDRAFEELAGRLLDAYWREEWALDPTKRASLENLVANYDRLMARVRLAMRRPVKPAPARVDPAPVRERVPQELAEGVIAKLRGASA